MQSWPSSASSRPSEAGGDVCSWLTGSKQSAPYALVFAVTSSAISVVTPCYVHVFGAQFVASFAMRLAWAMFADTAPKVLVAGDWLKVRRVDATPVPAEMVEVESVWDWPDKSLVDDAMGAQFARLLLCCLRLGDHAIAATALHLGRPVPASGFIVHSPFAEYALGWLDACPY